MNLGWMANIGNATSAAQNHPRSKVAAWMVIATTVVAGFEGLYTHPYYDSVHVRTVCYGETAADHVDLYRNYTKAECEQLLDNSLPKYDAPLQKCIKPEIYASLPAHRHAALVSLAFNIGTAGVCKSSVVRDLNAGRVKQACDDFLKFNRAGGRVLKGLTNRRVAERKLCLMSD